ncbi:MAG: outer-membrane lipoprotein LolB [Lysobacterales bacterium]|jgi:outer membrane lipoprotein LolB|nr:MAG: outer-membrane lipoprotein LolB [Xanthomonadales bacterium]
MRSAALLALIALGFGCARLETRPDPAQPPSARERERVLSASAGFEMQGRFAIRRDGRGGTGHFRWAQSSDALDLVLWPPGASGAVRLQAQGRGACLEGRPEGTLCGPDAERLLAEVLEAPVPLRALSWWLRGLRAPGSRSLARWSEGGLPLEIRQKGWTIRYRAWFEAMSPPMPRLIEAERGGVRVRVSVARWSRT